MSKTLICIDMQNDFVTGSLANPAAQAIVKPMAEYINNFDGNIIFTRDTHAFNYLETPEGKALPVKHCIKDTAGWCVEQSLIEAAETNLNGNWYTYVNKPTFGYTGWNSNYVYNDAKYSLGDEIVIVGTCTDICVVSNVLILKATFPEKKITVLKDLCAGLTREKHEAALEVMRSCQVEVI